MGFFGKIFGALKKTKDNISEKLRVLFSKNKLGDEFYEELEELLISSDVSVSTAEEVVSRVKAKAIEGRLSDQEYVTSLLRGILTDILEESEVEAPSYPCVIMLVGVNGVGKTTTVGKLAHYFLSQRKTVTVAAADTFRAAASEQLSIWAERAKVRIVKHEEGSDPSAVVFDAISSAKAKGTDVLIIDTAGRLHVKDNLMNELRKMERVVNREFPEADFLKLLVLDATTGQNALNQARVFDEAIELDGLVLTKLDGTAKGGFVFSLSSELSLPVIYAGTGEKMEDLEFFNSKTFVEAIL
ncbi:MAG: signal recognition particle-docking protein FtsY [Clostridia bacterium]|nr:signal recognition particle-docking protein FtsY [Clostridia bacterium]